MRVLVLSLFALLLVPVTAAAKDADAPVRVLWNSTPQDVRAGGTWDARLSLLQGPGGFYGGHTRPEIVVTDLAGGAERRVATNVDVSPNTFRAAVRFPRAGLYEVAVRGFDPRDRERFVDISAPVRIEPALSAATNAASWPWTPTVGAAIAVLLAGAWSIQRGRGRLGGRDAGGRV